MRAASRGNARDQCLDLIRPIAKPSGDDGISQMKGLDRAPATRGPDPCSMWNATRPTAAAAFRLDGEVPYRNRQLLQAFLEEDAAVGVVHQPMDLGIGRASNRLECTIIPRIQPLASRCDGPIEPLAMVRGFLAGLLRDEGCNAYPFV